MVRSKLVILAAMSVTLVLACQKPQPPVDFVKYKNEADVPRISISDAKNYLDNGAAIIVDARPQTSYDQEHAAGSINIPLGTPPDKIKDEIASAQGKKIIVYCS